MKDLIISHAEENISSFSTLEGSEESIRTQVPLKSLLSCNSYEEFLTFYEKKGRYKDIHIYNSGLETHHIIPKEVQKLKGIFPGDEGFDDTCINLTPFEHLYAHYLLAKEGYPGGLMGLNMRMDNISKLEEITLENLKDWSLLKQSAFKVCHLRPGVRKRMSESRKDFFKNMSDEERDSFRKKCKEVSNREELKERIIKKVTSFYDNLSGEEYEKWLNRQIEAHRTEEFRESCRQGQLKYHREMSDEEKKSFRDRYVKVSHSEEGLQWLEKEKEAYRNKKEESLSKGETPMSWNEFQKYYKSLGIPGYSKKKSKLKDKKRRGD